MSRFTITPQWVHAHTPALIPTRRHLPIEFTETINLHIPIHMPKQPVIIVKTEQGYEVISETLRCVKLAASEYEAHLFLQKYSETYRVVNDTSRVGQDILARARTQGVIRAVALN